MKIIRLKKDRTLSAEGKRLLNMYRHNEGYALYEVYTDWSYSKERAYGRCWNFAFADHALDSFHICSHSTFRFTVAWLNSEGDIRIETPQNSYLVEMPK